MIDRITKYVTGNLGIVVNGVRVLLTVSAEQADTAAALAEAIAAIGPEGIEPIAKPAPTPAVRERPKAAKRFDVGQDVWCTVTAIRGWKTVTAVHADGRIKIDGGRVWCPLHNFEAAPPAWQRSA
jgi:hypothetical protein